MNDFRQRCIELRDKDYTLPEIVRMTGRAKSSVYFHIRDLPLSALKQQNIKERSRKQASETALARKGKSIRIFRPFSTWDVPTVCLVSHLLFDGEVNNRGCTYNNRNISLLKRVEACMKGVYDFEPKKYKNALTGVLRISYYNVALGAYMQQKSLQLLDEIVGAPKELKREFLRAFFDDEGCMDFRPKERRRGVRGYQKNTRILNSIQTLLADFHITATLKLPNEVVVTGKNNLQKFQQEINFSPGIFINGERSNSIWKEDLEKRELLIRALNSFK